jgi:hypothetical protein
MVTEQPIPVHFYVEVGQTFADRVLCHDPGQGLNTHVTEYGNQVTCEACRALLKGTSE